MPDLMISCETLLSVVGTPTAPVILDLRIDEDVAAAPFVIPGAVRHPFLDVENLTPSLEGRAVVIYCQKGKKISQGGAALLRQAGVPAQALNGGQVAWRDFGFPQIEIQALPARDTKGRTRWVISDPVAPSFALSGWIVRRFIDAHAVFLPVEHQEVCAVADRFEATPMPEPAALLSQVGLVLPALQDVVSWVEGAPDLQRALKSASEIGKGFDPVASATSFLDALFAAKRAIGESR